MLSTHGGSEFEFITCLGGEVDAERSGMCPLYLFFIFVVRHVLRTHRLVTVEILVCFL